eukprot:9625808-Karenia_brevis.AAC.1
MIMIDKDHDDVDNDHDDDDHDDADDDDADDNKIGLDVILFHRIHSSGSDSSICATCATLKKVSGVRMTRQSFPANTCSSES